MQLPPVAYYPPFNITRASHVVLSCRDLGKSLAFYTEVIGLVVSDQDSEHLYLRGVEEACHHSLVLEKNTSDKSFCKRLGMRVFLDEDLDRAHRFFSDAGLPCGWIDVPHQGRTLIARDASGMPLELCATMDVCERQFTNVAKIRGGGARRLDHYQCYISDIAKGNAFYAKLGFRMSEYIEVKDKLVAAFLFRKGNTHDLVLFEGLGPQLHHIGFTISDPTQIFRACDIAGSAGFGDSIDRGPGRHGLDGALFVYFNDPDGHRIELFDGHYQTIDTELEPRRWDGSGSRQPWGFPAQESWFSNCSPFEGQPVSDPVSPSHPFTLEQYLAARAQKSQ